MEHRAKKSLGQHFLIAPNSIKSTVEAAALSPKDTVLEVGPGHGALTKELLAQGAKVVAVEKDDRLIAELEETFAAEVREERFSLVHGDILEEDLSTLDIPEGYKVVANIPYYITGILIRTLLTAHKQPSHVVLIVQKEIAERIARDEKESILSLSVKAYGTPRYVGTIKRGAFKPQPNVDSAILCIEAISRDFFTNISEERFFEVVKAGFASKRKYLLNNLEAIAPKEELRGAFQAAGLDEKVRAEDVPLLQWRELASALQ